MCAHPHSLAPQFQRFNRVEDIPSWYFSRRKALRVRLVRQSASDPSIFLVYHTPLLRRVVLQDTLPPLVLHDAADAPHLLAVRPFGVQVDESAQEWLYSNFVSSQRYMTIHLLHRCAHELESVVTWVGVAADAAYCRLSIPDAEGESTVATCNMSLRRVRGCR